MSVPEGERYIDPDKSPLKANDIYCFYPEIPPPQLTILGIDDFRQRRGSGRGGTPITWVTFAGENAQGLESVLSFSVLKSSFGVVSGIEIEFENDNHDIRLVLPNTAGHHRTRFVMNPGEYITQMNVIYMRNYWFLGFRVCSHNLPSLDHV